MSATAQSPAATRPTTITAAVAGLVSLAVLAFPTAILFSDGFDPIFYGIGTTLTLLKLIAAIGLWRCRRWAAILGFVATALDVLLTLPGFVDGTMQEGMVPMAFFVIIGIASLVLIALPSSRHAYV